MDKYTLPAPGGCKELTDCIIRTCDVSSRHTSDYILLNTYKRTVGGSISDQLVRASESVTPSFKPYHTETTNGAKRCMTSIGQQFHFQLFGALGHEATLFSLNFVSP